MKRRYFLKSAAVASVLAPAFGFRESHAAKSHLISFSFDDGFKKSFLKLADIHEEYGLKACMNVIASGHLPSFRAVGEWILPELMGDFEDWNHIVERGHEVMPHSWEHNNLTKTDTFEAKQLMSKCIVYFNEQLIGFKPKKAVFNFPFNASNAALENHGLRLVGAVRTIANGAINPFPSKATTRVLGCESHGPGLSDAWVEDKVNSFLAGSGGWMILNLHGLDDEGWGPISTDYFVDLLEKLAVIKHLEIIPVGKALEKYG